MSIPASSIPLRDRLAALSPRERKFLFVGGVALLLFLVFLLLPSSDEEEPGVELADAPPAAAVAPPPAPPPASFALSTPPPPPPPAAIAAPGTGAAMVLRGVMGGGPSGGAAIFAMPDGSQRLVRIGREIQPGMTLTGIGISHATLSSGGGALRMELNKPGAVPVAQAAPTPAPTPAAVPAAPASAPDRQRETLQYRTGLTPVKAGGRTTGFAIKPGASLPMLERAGLRPGDVLLAVNGQPFDREEKVVELAGEIAGSYTAEFEYERAGKRMKSAVEINKRSLR